MTSGSGTPTGAVTFAEGTSTLATAALADGTATWSTSSLAAGSHTISVTYDGDSSHLPSGPASLVQVVGPPPPATTTATVHSDGSPAVAGATVTFTAELSAAGGPPTGSVTFLDGTTPLGTIALVGGGASLATSGLSVGTHSITVRYAGNSSFAAATSAPLAQVIDPAPPQPIDCSANAVAPGPIPTSLVLGQHESNTQVGLYDETQEMTVGPAGLTVDVTTPGLYLGPPSSTVIPPGTVVSGHLFHADPVANDDVHLNACRSFSAPIVGIAASSAILDGSDVFGARATRYSTAASVPDRGFEWGDPTDSLQLDGDLHTVRLRLWFNGAMDETRVFTQGSKAPSIASVTSSAPTSVWGQTVTFTATVAPFTGTGTLPTGSVTFLRGGVAMGNAALVGGHATFSTASLAVGTGAVSVIYNGSATYAVSYPTSVAQTVSKAQTVTGLTLDRATSVAGEPVTMTATVGAVAPGAGVPAGSVAFRSGSTLLASVALSASGSASFTTAALAVGTDHLTAVYSGSGKFVASTSPVVDETVGKASTTVLLTVDRASSVKGQAVALTAAVSPVAPGSGVPGGSVTFFSNGVAISTKPLSNGRATLSTTGLAVGSDTLTASFLGAGRFLPSTSNTVTEVVGKAATATSLTVDHPTSVAGQTVTFTATVATLAPGSIAPTGTVSFKSSSFTLGGATVVNGKATLTVSTLAVGSRQVTATYNGSTNSLTSTSAPVTITVTRAVTAVALSVDHPASPAGAAVAFSSSVTPVAPGAGVPTGHVLLMEGDTRLADLTLTAGAASWSTTTLAIGSHQMVAVYQGDGRDLPSTSSPVTVEITPAPTAVSLTSSGSPATFGRPLTLTAALTSLNGTPTGSVEFFDGATSLGSVGIANGTAVLTTSSLSVGSHNLTVAYAASGPFAASTSAILIQQIDPALDTAVTLAHTTGAPNDCRTDSLIATVTYRSAPGTPTGSVEFTDNGIVLGTAPVAADGTARRSTSLLEPLSLGNHTFGATYHPDAASIIGSAAAEVTTTVALNGDPASNLWAWGDGSGSLGNGIRLGSGVPIPVGTAPEWAQISSGHGFTLAIKADGTLWGWGYNGSGQLGTGGTDGSPTCAAHRVGTGAQWQSVSAGRNFTLGVQRDGSLWSWGWNIVGQLGDGTKVDRHAPTQIGAGRHWVAASAGETHTVALADDGTLWAWGQNSYGQLGDGTTTDRLLPTQVAPGTAWRAASVGPSDTLAIASDGSLWAWGSNGSGKLGDGSQLERHAPTRIGTDTTWTSVSPGGDHTLAVTRDGSLFAWGGNVWGQLGDGTRTTRLSPVLIGGGWTSASAARDNATSYGVRADGSLWAWGDGYLGAAGDGLVTDHALSWPTQIGTGSDWVAADAGWGGAVALERTPAMQVELAASTSGSPSEVGRSVTLMVTVTAPPSSSRTPGGAVEIYEGSTLVGTATLSGVGLQAVGSITVDTLAVGPHVLDLRYGGDGWFLPASRPAALTQVVEPVTTGGGTMWAWGDNSSTQLGDGSAFTRPVPTPVGSDTDWASISAGGHHSVGVKADGSLWAWGSNGSGQLGDGSTIDRWTPTRIGSDTDWASISAGSVHSLGVKADGSLWAWGSNGSGQLGDGSTIDRWTPTRIGSDTDWASISAGAVHSLGMKADGSLWAWGSNGYGQLGDGSTTDRWTPTRVGSDTDWASISAGSVHSLGVKADGSLWAWGYNGYGQLGDGSTTDRWTPTRSGPTPTGPRSRPVACTPWG